MRGIIIPNALTEAAQPVPCFPVPFTDPLTEGARRTLGVCTYGIWDEDAYQLYMDVDTLGKLLETLDETSLRAAKSLRRWSSSP